MTSSEDQNYQKDDYLFDFLYVDRARIASYAAQVFDDGVLTSTKTVSSVNSSSSDKTSFGFPKLISAELGATDATQNSIERQYDAAWHLPLNLLGELDEQGFIQPRIEKATLGQIVHFKGKIQIIDLRMVQSMWEPLMHMQHAGLPDMTTAQKKAKKEAAANQKHMVQIVQNLPHGMQFRGFNDEAQIWSTLEPGNMTINTSDLAFKHGASIPGHWSVLGILDATPERGSTDISFPRDLTELEQGMLQMMLALQVFLGRRDGDYGVTPLAIYRTITK